MTKGGPGDLILNGANTFTGPITVSAGTLQLGDGLPGHDTVLSGNIANNGALVVNLNGNQSYAGTISGLGSVTKGGTGTLTLTAAQSYGGPTVITQGTVKLQGGSNIPTAGLLGEWLMNGNAKDSSGNGYNGTPVNNPTFSPNGGQGGAPCLQLSGNGDFVYVNDGTPTQSVFDGGSVMSVSAWVKGWPGTWEAWVSKDGEPAGWQMRRYGSDNQLCFTMRGVSTNDYEGNSTAVSDGNWHMVTMTYDANGGANNESIYIDGVLTRRPRRLGRSRPPTTSWASAPRIPPTTALRIGIPSSPAAWTTSCSTARPSAPRRCSRSIAPAPTAALRPPPVAFCPPPPR